MSTRVIIIIGVVIVLLIAGGVVGFMMLNKPETSTQAETLQTSQPNPSPASTKNSIQGLLSAGKNVSCTFSDSDQNSHGIVYVSDGKFRGDFTSTNPNNGPVLSHMIQTAGFGYFWTDGGKTGTKIDLTAAKNSVAATVSANQSSQEAEINKQSFPTDKQVDTTCSNWTVDNTKFVVPTDVQFTDLSQALKNLPASKSGTPKINASACNSISDPKMKAACLKAVSGY